MSNYLLFNNLLTNNFSNINNQNEKNLTLDKEKLFETFLAFQNFLNNNNANLSPQSNLNSNITNSNINNISPISNTNKAKIINHDDIVIKPNNGNFIELLESALKNEKEEEHKQPNSNSKRKIIRTEIKRMRRIQKKKFESRTEK